MSLRRLIVAAAALVAVATAARAETIKIGATPGPHAQILEAVKPIAAKNGLDIQIVEFTDYVVPNAALDAGDLQANSFQNQPYLDNQKADRGYKIEAVGLTVNFPMGVYSKKYKSWDAVPAGATLSIPQRSDQWRPRAAAVAGQGRAETQAGRRVQADHRRHRRQSEEVQDRGSGCRADRANAGGRRRRRGQYQLCHAGGSRSGQGLPSSARIRRDPTPTCSRCAAPTRTSLGSRSWSTAITRRR